MTSFLVGIFFLLLAAPVGLLANKGSGLWEKVGLLLLLVGAGCGMGGVVQAMAIPGGIAMAKPWSVPGGNFALALDGLAAIFLLPAFLLVAAGGIYALGYLPTRQNAASGVWSRFFYPLLAASIAILLAANNALLFLIAWECMALCGYFLVCTDRQDEEAQGAGFLYLTCTHGGTLVLLAFFALLITLAGAETLPAPGSLDGSLASGTAVFLLALLGFGLKAGIIPLHIWLPRTHAAAPSHVSALMSGVMIKTGIYGLIRTVTFFHSPPSWWGWTILLLGVVAAVLGVVLAIAQHDLKRLLAYHSVENIGIILIGLGTALLGAHYREPTLLGLGLAGALLHTINHGLFKGLLFLSAGAMIKATGSRELARYGGLLRSMPLTGIFFLAGAVAICGLPPLNGFVSEWLVYLGLFHASGHPSVNLTLAGLAIPALALTGGLALLCFSKVFGLSFLGQPRLVPAGENREAPRSMLIGMGMLLAGCLWIGLLPGTMLPLLVQAISGWSRALDLPLALAELAPAGTISLFALLLLLLVVALRLVSRLGHRPASAADSIWGCGYPFATPRMQYSAASFAQMVGELFSWARWSKSSGAPVRGLFPGPSSLATHTPDAVLDLLLLPACRQLARWADRSHHLIHHGILSIYILYIVLALGPLLWLALS